MKTDSRVGLTVVALVAALGGLTACSSAAPDACAIGGEGCACTGGGACDDGLTCASSICVRAGGVATAGSTATAGSPGTGGPGSGSAGGAGGSSVAAPPAILIGTWTYSPESGPCYNFRVDSTCAIGVTHTCDKARCTYGVAGGATLPTLSAPWLIQLRFDCCAGPLGEGGAYSRVMEVAAIDDQSLTYVDRFDDGTLRFNALTRQP
jgi:hypothetical protein